MFIYGHARCKKVPLVLQMIKSKLEKLVNKATNEVRKWSRPKTSSCKNVSVLKSKEKKGEAYRKGKERRGGGTIHPLFFKEHGWHFICHSFYLREIRHIEKVLIIILFFFIES